jgi:hypothetical protein
MFYSARGAALWLLLLTLPPNLLSQDQRAALLAADRQVSRRSADSSFVSAMQVSLDQNGVLLWPGAPLLIGSAELGTFARLGAAGSSLRLTWQPLGLELARDSSLGVTWGVAVSSSRFTADPPRLGRYIATWARHGSRWNLAALVLMGVDGSSDTVSWSGIRMTRIPAGTDGAAGRFIAADLAFARLAAASGAAIAFGRFAAPEALSFGGGSLLVRGAEAISRAVAGPERWHWYPVTGGSARDGDLGWTVGEATIASADRDALHSKYLTVWTRRQDGTIRFLLDGGNARPTTR